MSVQRILYSVFVITLALPIFANAEIYKWKDKNGVMRYSDTPPPVSVKADTLGKTGKEKLTRRAAPTTDEVNGSETPKIKDPEVSPDIPKEQAEQAAAAEEEAARVRAENAENEKRNKLEKQKQAKIDAENCKSARANYQSYAQGGRVYKMNEKGERVYMDDAGLDAGKMKAQAEISKYCK